MVAETSDGSLRADGSYNGTPVVSELAKYSGMLKRGERKIGRTGQGKCHCHHLVVFPVPEEVNGSVSPALNNSPASVVYILLTPGLYLPFCFIRFDKVHAAGAVASFLRRQTVSKRT